MADERDHKQKDDSNSGSDNVASEVLEHLKNPPVEVINPNDSGSSAKKYILIIAVVVVLAAGGFAAWKLLLAEDNQPTDQQEQPAAANQQEITEENDPISQLTQEYTSDRLLIDVKHPADWKVDESDDGIIVYSQATEITNEEGVDVPAEFRVMIKQGAQESDSEYLGRGLAVGKSRPIQYTDPAANQREKTFVTDFGLDSSNYFSYFVVQGNFNLNKDETLGPNFASEDDAVLVSGGFYSDDSSDKTELVSLELENYKNNKTYQTAIEIVKTLRLR